MGPMLTLLNAKEQEKYHVVSKLLPTWLYLKQTFWAPEDVGTYVHARKLYASGVPLGWTPKTLGDSTTTRGVP